MPWALSSPGLLMAGLVNIVQRWTTHCCAILLHVEVHRLLPKILASWTEAHYFNANRRYGVHLLDHLYCSDVLTAVKLHRRQLLIQALLLVQLVEFCSLTTAN